MWLSLNQTDVSQTPTTHSCTIHPSGRNKEGLRVSTTETSTACLLHLNQNPRL